MWMPMDVQMNHGSSNAHVQWFSCQKNGADDHDITCDVMRISHASKREGTIKGEHD